MIHCDGDHGSDVTQAGNDRPSCRIPGGSSSFSISHDYAMPSAAPRQVTNLVTQTDPRVTFRNTTPDIDFTVDRCTYDYAFLTEARRHHRASMDHSSDLVITVPMPDAGGPIGVSCEHNTASHTKLDRVDRSLMPQLCGFLSAIGLPYARRSILTCGRDKLAGRTEDRMVDYIPVRQPSNLPPRPRIPDAGRFVLARSYNPPAIRAPGRRPQYSVVSL